MAISNFEAVEAVEEMMIANCSEGIVLLLDGEPVTSRATVVIPVTLSGETTVALIVVKMIDALNGPTGKERLTVSEETGHFLDLTHAPRLTPLPVRRLLFQCHRQLLWIQAAWR